MQHNKANQHTVTQVWPQAFLIWFVCLALPLPGVLGDLLPECTIDFDGPCPNAGSICGASFEGGEGCLFEGLADCYSTGLQAYKVTPDAPLTVLFDADVISIDVFFAHVTGASGTMRFFNTEGQEVDEPLTTNGDCFEFMPAQQEVVFSETIASMEITAIGGDVWIDTLTVNPVIPMTPGDLNGDGIVDVEDLFILLSEWGKCANPEDCPADLNDDGIVNVEDLFILLSHWG